MVDKITIRHLRVSIPHDPKKKRKQPPPDEPNQRSLPERCDAISAVVVAADDVRLLS